MSGLYQERSFSAKRTVSPLPSYPFEKICANYFFVENKPYLAIVDRLSGWLSLYAFKPNQANHSTLIDTFRYLFTVYGVSEELSSDGGPQFAAKEFQEFLKLWQVKHRLSSVAYPSQTEGQSLGSKLRNVLFIIIGCKLKKQSCKFNILTTFLDKWCQLMVPGTIFGSIVFKSTECPTLLCQNMVKLSKQ